MQAPDWNTDGAHWPNRENSRFIQAGGLRWHVQTAGDGPVMLLLHGTGAATHSWSALLPLLARHFTVIAPDLPGHGFTAAPASAGMALPPMARAVDALLHILQQKPRYALGHSAGAAILLRMCLDGLIAPERVFAVNGAMLPLRSRPMHVFAPLARLLSASTLVPRLFAWHASDRQVVARLLADTGSTLAPAQRDLYARLARRPAHVAAALAMMAHWDLFALREDLHRLSTPLTMVVGGNDRTVPPEEAAPVQAILPHSELVVLPGLGHLAHEEQPQQVLDIVLART